MNKKINIKKLRIKINNYNDFKNELIKEGYKLEDLNLSNDVLDYINKSFKENKITYKVLDINDFVSYIKKIIIFEKLHNEICSMLRNIKILEINRLEYERMHGQCENVKDIILEVSNLKNSISEIMAKEDIKILEILEKEIEENHVYSKDIELLKRIIIKENNVYERYNNLTKVKTLSINVPLEINKGYIKGEKGSVEYHKNLSNSIIRMKRLLKNLHRYITIENGKYIINQSNTLQDSINIAEAFFNGKSFKAVSGSNEIEDYNYIKSAVNPCFKSLKVNKLGKLGIGYNRVNDSEKKILEEIHKEIESGILEDKGTIYMYTKWEPCGSCYYVISQFNKMYPFINIKVKYLNSYGRT